MRSSVLALMLCFALCANAEDASRDAARTGQLKHLGGIIKAYGIIHGNKPPAKLSDLYRDGLADSLSDFVRPGSGTRITIDSEIDAKSDYTLESLPDAKDVLVREKMPADNNILVMFADGSIKPVPSPQTAGAASPAPEASSSSSPPSAPTVAAASPTPSPSMGELVSKVTPPVATPVQTPETNASAPPVGEARQILNFDGVQPGSLPGDLFPGSGVRVVRGKGEPGVYKTEPNMVLPPGRNKVLLVAGGRVTSMTFTFATPIKRFTISRIGTAGGASVPTWTMDAYDGKGEVVDSVGEEHGLPKTPQDFSVKGNDIVRVQLSTDNRFGSGTWATWNSLPVVQFVVER